MNHESPGWKGFLKDLGLRIGGAVGAVLLIVFLVFLGDFFNIGFLQSRGGVFVSVIVLGELLFFGILVFAVLQGEL
ncbi:hypothetical protein [Candidatus Nanohalobium constans]|uniref:hypothetical protein n=1 Tax=Candidatus Nanohalobium constans TaxID=2565781 RepID=UPI0012982DDD|nr:hypothetical protein [Candidatus Nanohalobium constans]